MRRALLLAVAVGCGGGTETTSVDAMPDAIVSIITLSPCPAVVDMSITDTPTAFSPKDTTIPRTGIVKFVITSEHFVLPNTLTTTDPALTVGRGETKCFKMMVKGTYGFLCGVHGFTGTITVQ